LARRLASRGIAVLRFDYYGLGDSAGCLDDVTDAEEWTESIRQAIEYGLSLGLPNLSIVGMRMGATIAALATAKASWRPKTLVLWDPCISGRRFLREQSLLHRTMRNLSRDVGDAAVETPGYVFSAEAASALRSVQLPAMAELPDGVPLLVLCRDDRPVPRETGRWEAGGARVAFVPGQEDLLDVPPLDAVVPEDTIDMIIEHVTGEMNGELMDASALLRQEMFPLPGVRERVVSVGDGLFGIVGEPVGESTETTAIFFNVAIESHVGPARLWVTLARRWASDLGLSSVRFDFSGVGDSPSLGSGAQDLLYASDWIDDADRVVLEMARSSKRVIGVGVCSGAYAALESALRNDRVDVVAINPLLDTVEGALLKNRPGTIDRRRKAVREIPRALHPFVMAHHRIAEKGWRALQWVVPRLAAGSVIAAVIRRGGRVLLALTDEDARAFDVNPYWRIRVRSWRRRHDLTRVDVPELDHPALVAAGRLALVEELNRSLSALLRSGTRRAAEDELQATRREGV